VRETVKNSVFLIQPRKDRPGQGCVSPLVQQVDGVGHEVSNLEKARVTLQKLQGLRL